MSAQTVINEVVSPRVPIKVKVELTQELLEAYEAKAREANVEVEAYLSEHLRQTAKHDHSGASLYFNSDQSKRLCKLTGRGICTDPDRIVERLEPLTHVKLGDVKVAFDAQVFDRIKHNYKVRKGVITAAQFVERAAINGVRTEVGLPLK